MWMREQPENIAHVYLTGGRGVQDIGGLGVVLPRGRNYAKSLFVVPTLVSPRLHIQPVIQA